MIAGLILLFPIAVVDWLAVARNWKKIEYIAKPAAMLWPSNPFAPAGAVMRGCWPDCRMGNCL